MFSKSITTYTNIVDRQVMVGPELVCIGDPTTGITQNAGLPKALLHQWHTYISNNSSHLDSGAYCAIQVFYDQTVHKLFNLPSWFWWNSPWTDINWTTDDINVLTKMISVFYIWICNSSYRYIAMHTPYCKRRAQEKTKCVYHTTRS